MSRPMDCAGASRSTGIRFAKLVNLYQVCSRDTSTLQDPANDGLTTNIITGAVGNSGLVPEAAYTSTIVVFVTPDDLFRGFLAGASISVCPVSS